MDLPAGQVGDLGIGPGLAQLLAAGMKAYIQAEPLPMVGMVVTISPSFSLYRMVVFPAASRPTIKMRISFFPIRLLRRFPKIFPMITVAAF